MHIFRSFCVQGRALSESLPFQRTNRLNDTGLFLNKKTSALASRSFFSFPSEVYDNEKLQENKKIADQAIHYVRSKIKKVPTMGIEPPATQETFHDWVQANDKIGKMRDLREQIYRAQTSDKQNDFVSREIAAYLAQKSGYGNCGEMGSLLLMRLIEIGYLGRAAIFQIRRPEGSQLPEGVSSAKCRTHTFVVVGLSANKLTSDYQSFGVNAVVVDPFSQDESYPLHEIPTRLKNYYGLDSHARPILAKIDPIVDSIHLLCSNIFSSYEFIEPFSLYDAVQSDAGKIANLLNCFHVSASREQKMCIANEILVKAALVVNKLNLDLNNLRNEFRHKKEKIDKQKSQQELDVNSTSKMLGDLEKMIKAHKKILACQENIDSLCSQLKKFKDPTSLSFELDNSPLLTHLRSAL